MQVGILGRKSHQKVVNHDTPRYRRRNRIEIMVGRLKDWQRVAIRITPDARRHIFPPPLRLQQSCSGCET